MVHIILWIGWLLCVTNAQSFGMGAASDYSEPLSRYNNTENVRNLPCALFEDLLSCGPTCQVTCETLGKACPPGPCQRGCFCETGKVRSTKTGRCISQKLCPSKYLRLKQSKTKTAAFD